MSFIQRLWSVFWALIILALLFAFRTAHAHNHELEYVVPSADVDQLKLPFPAVLECFKLSKAEKVDAYVTNWQGLEVFVLEIDTNEDGKRDGLLLYPIFKHTKEYMDISTSASHVVLDLDYDGHPDGAWFDRTAKGTCDTLQSIPLSTILKDARKHAHGR